MRICRVCQNELPLDAFRQRPTQQSFICRSCERARQRKKETDTCSKCGGEKNARASVCKACDFATRKGHHRLGATIAGRSAECPRCGGRMNAASTMCWSCSVATRKERNQYGPGPKPWPVVDRFIRKTLLTSSSYLDCIEWHGYRHNNYGIASLGRKPIGAHRVSYELFVGPIPPGMTIDHLCFNTFCVNPFHLDVCSRSENTRRAHAHRLARSAHE